MIYFDSAATTFQKPASVYRAVARAMQTMSSPGRGGYAQARAAEEMIFRCRAAAAELFGVESEEQVVFTTSATHGLNIAIKSLIHPGDRVIVSGYEHNAVTRPLHALGAEIIVAGGSPFDPESILRSFARAIAVGADAVVCTQASNVFGYILPIEQIAALCRSARIPLIVDAAQSAGILPLDLCALGAAFIAMPGHKGLYGPQGTGLLLCARRTQPLLEGGTGSESLIQDMPEFLPDRLEAGTLNVPGIAGLEAGLRFVKTVGPQRLLRHEQALVQQAAQQLSRLPGITCYHAQNTALQAGVLSFTVQGQDAEAVAQTLSERGIAVRAGLHCAPFAHKTAGTLDTGTVRVSFSAFNRMQEVETLAHALRDAGR